MRCRECGLCHKVSGLGGAAFFHDIRLGTAPAGSGLIELLGERYTRREAEALALLQISGVAQRPQVTTSMNLLPNETKRYQSVELSRSAGNRVAQRLAKGLRKQGALHLGCEVQSLMRAKGEWILTHSDGEDCFDMVVLATGKANWGFVTRLCHELSLETEPFYFEFGARIQMLGGGPIVPSISSNAELKLSVELTRGVSARTFCWEAQGRSVCFAVDGIVCLEGQPCHTSSGGLSFAVLMRDYGTTLDKARSYVGRIRERYGNHQLELPVSQSLVSFLEQKDCSGQPPPGVQLGAVGSIAELMGEKYAVMLREGIGALGVDGFPGVSTAWISAPCLERVMPRLAIGPMHMTSSDGLYCIGDCSGLYRGTLQAAIAGLDLAVGLPWKNA
jgi:uncharacterized FAD-dependent dehydrogenase